MAVPGADSITEIQASFKGKLDFFENEVLLVCLFHSDIVGKAHFFNSQPQTGETNDVDR